MDDPDDLNNVSLTGKVKGSVGMTMTPERYVLSFEMVVSKFVKASGTVRVNRFKVVMFDGLALKHEKQITIDQSILVQGELEENFHVKAGRTTREIRVIGRFMKILGGS